MGESGSRGTPSAMDVSGMDGSVEQCEQYVLLGEVMTWEPDSVALSADSWPLSAKSA